LQNGGSNTTGTARDDGSRFKAPFVEGSGAGDDAAGRVLEMVGAAVRMN